MCVCNKNVIPGCPTSGRARVACFHPGVLNGASLWQGAPRKPTSLALFPVLKEVLFLSLSVSGLQFQGSLKP